MALTHFWKLIAANLLFVLFSLPVITLPAALTALNRVCVILYKDGNIFLWTEFCKEFKRSFLRSLLPGAGFALLLFGGYYFMSLGNGNLQLGFVGIVFWAIGILMAAVAIILGQYYFVVSAVLDIGVGGAMKNSLLLWMSRPRYGLLILTWVVLLSVAITAMLPIGLIPLLFIWVVLVQYPVSFLVYDVTEDLVLLPYEKQQSMMREKSEKDGEPTNGSIIAARDGRD